MTYNFTQEQHSNLRYCFGNNFTDALPARIAGYSEKWTLTDFTLIEYYSVNCLFTCRSEKHGDCVLKIFGGEREYYLDEIRALQEFDGRCRYVKVHECDEADGALLLARVRPGVTLKTEPSLDERILTFARVWQDVHIAPHDPSGYKSYAETVELAAVTPWANGEIPKLRQEAKDAVTVCGDLYRRYPQRLLLHGDLHGDNLLKNDARGEYTIVDPHGRIGPPVCDVGRYITNEYIDAAPNERVVTAETVTDRLSEFLKLPKADIMRAFFVDITLMTCWDAEDGTAEIDGVVFAKSLLNV